LRFPGFEGEWETKKLGEIMDFKVTNSFSRENLNYEIGTVKNIHYGDIHTKFQALFDIQKEIVPFINEEINLDRISEDNYCKEGDLIFADASEDLNDVGKSIEIINVNGEKLLSGLHTLLARPKSSIFHLGFNGYLFKSNSVRTQIQKESQGSKVLSINVGRISKIELSFPTANEQKRITALLGLLDERIQTQNKIIKELNVLKDTFTKKIFSRQLKFKDENGHDYPKWELNKIKDIGTFSVGGDLNKLNYQKEKSEEYIYPIYANGASSGLYGYANSFQYPENCVTVSGRGNLGLANVRCEKFCAIVRLIVIRPHSDINPKYLQEIINNIDFAIESTGVPQLTVPQISNYSVTIPCFEEQSKIANFFSSVDRKIEIEAQFLQKLEEQKKFILQQMFI